VPSIAAQTSKPDLAFVLDDEPQIGALVCKVLHAIGLVGEQFQNPIECLSRLKMERPEFLILDLALGSTDAIDIIRQLEIVKFRGKVLLISGRDHDTLGEIERIGRAHGLTMLPALQKPFRAAALKDRLTDAVSVPVVEPREQAAENKRVLVDRRVLDEALRHNLLELWYQPKIDLKSLSICGAEALIRARHPERGLIAPIELLPPAGDPLYQTLSTFVIRQAVSDWASFSTAGVPLRLSVNIPASVLHAPGFVDMVRQMLPREPGFPGLMIEVTEDEIIRDPAWVYEVATQLKLYNVWISIDDFGSAYASLSRLKDLPFAELKLDRSFVDNCAADPLKRGVCETVVALTRRFGASLCAEGVETADDLRCLIGLGFDTAQGFFFAKPMPAAQLRKSLIKQAAERPGTPAGPG
jgi:EAL domain-containing protein (putative c-di-GMP-specific phosphodiesterase class I)/FixJ family two-component response regulator